MTERDADRGHCITTIRAIVARDGDDRRSILQLGYNLGRLSELTGLGREPFWDRWKDAVTTWDRDQLSRLAADLTAVCQTKPSALPGE